MLGFFKKPLQLGTVLVDLVAMLHRMRKTVDSLASDEGIDKTENYPAEASAFVYILGWFAIQSSDLSFANKQRFSAELTGTVAKDMSPGNTAMQIALIKLLQERIGAYHYALDHGKGRDWAAKLVFRFMEYLGADTPEHVGMQAALCGAAPSHIAALKDFLTGINKTYKFV